MSLADIKTVFSDPQLRSEALRRLTPVIIVPIVGIAQVWRNHLPIAHALVLTVVIVPLWVHGVAVRLVRPPTREQAIRRLAVTWSLLAVSILLLYYFFLRKH